MLDCPHAAVCPGCTQLHRPYEEQLAWKHRRLQGVFAPYPELNALPIAPVVPASPVVGYRTRAKWIVDSKGRVGLFARGSHEVVDLPACQVVAPSLLRVGQLLRGALAAPGWLQEHLRAIDLREVRSSRTTGVLVTLVIDERRPPPVARAREASAFLAASPDVLGVALNLVSPKSPQVLGPQTLPLHGLAEVEDTLGVSTIRATFGAFTQAHRGQAAALQRAIADAAQGPALELYGGSGSLGLAIAHRGFAVDSVESFEPASRAAAEAAEAAGVPLRAVVGDAVEVVRELAQKKQRYDLVVVNPPRRGLAPAAREAIAALAPRCIAYMSCEPRTIARDLAHLARLGYTAAKASPHDMIPLTDEIETLVLLERRTTQAPAALGEVGEGIFFAKAAHESMEGLLARIRGIPGLERAVLASRLEREISGPCLAVREPSFLGVWQAALAAARWRWRGWVRGVTHRSGALGAGVRYRRTGVHGGHSLLEIQASTGQTRLARARLASLGHPVLGDERHGHEDTNRYFFEKFGLDRPFVHVASVALTCPGQPGDVTLACPWPADLVLPDGPDPG